MEEGKKGTVTSLASLYPIEETQLAARKVEEAIRDKQNELDHLLSFSSDNTELIKLVQRLPNELSHHVMVPFGKAAFFPGRLIHTNEFLVLLGEGYYAERTSKQTVGILERRGELLDTKIDSLKAMMLDLKNEASFFSTAANEAAEGLVEIREDYMEEDPPDESASNQADLSKTNLGPSKGANMEVDTPDDEYARIMAKLDELEREELAAEKANEFDEDEDVETDYGCSRSQQHFSQSLKSFEDNSHRGPERQLQNMSLHNKMPKALPSGDHFQQSYSKQSTFEDLKSQHQPKDESLNAKKSVKVNPAASHVVRPESNEMIHVASSAQVESSGAPPKASADDSHKVSANSISSSSGRIKAFTGSIIEHTDGIETMTTDHSSTSQSTGSNPSKPVSRFRKGLR